jgi:hypothetical protein
VTTVETQAVAEWAGLAAPVAAALVTGLVTMWLGRNRLTRLKAAVEIRDRMDLSLRDSWDNMIRLDAQAVMRQSRRPPVILYALVGVGYTIWLVARFNDAPEWLTWVGLGAGAIGGIGVFAWAVLYVRDTKSVGRTIERHLEEMTKKESELKERLARTGPQLIQARAYARQLLIDSGAPMKVVSREMDHLDQAIAQGKDAHPREISPDALQRPTWRARRWLRRRFTRGRLPSPEPSTE